LGGGQSLSRGKMRRRGNRGVACERFGVGVPLSWAQLDQTLRSAGEIQTVQWLQNLPGDWVFIVEKLSVGLKACSDINAWKEPKKRR